jgi:hypothetical protein
VLRRIVGWTLGLFGLLSLVPGLILVLFMVIGAVPPSQVTVRGGGFGLAKGLCVTGLLLWGSVTLLKQRPARGPVWR